MAGDDNTIGNITVEERQPPRKLEDLTEERIERTKALIRKEGTRVRIADEDDFVDEEKLGTEEGMKGRHQNALSQWLLANAEDVE